MRIVGALPMTPIGLTIDGKIGRESKVGHWLLFALILAIGTLARTWEFGRLPPGLNPDEASMGVEAYSLYHYGVDRNGISFPVHLISWGDGQNALYAYLLIPFLAAAGRLSPLVVRLPMLLTGMASLPLAYLVGRWTLDRKFGLLAMFFLAISPWHILLSRWAFDGNILPFVFLAGYACLLRAETHGSLIIPACLLLGLSLYAYATAYAMVPLFLLCAFLMIARLKNIAWNFSVGGLLAFILVAAPIGLFVLVNAARLPSMGLGPITIPRFPMPPRFESQTMIGTPNRIAALAANLTVGGALLINQTDGLPQNVVDPFGYFYTITLPLGLIGVWVLGHLLGHADHRWGALLMLSWLGTSISVAILHPVNINRFNIIFIPLIMCMALAVQWLSSRWPWVMTISVTALLLGFAAFLAAYNGMQYRRQANQEFQTGIIPALRLAQSKGNGPICLTLGPGEYIYALFTDPMNPASYLQTIRYDDPSLPGRTVLSLGRYAFGPKNCTATSQYTYVLAAAETPPRLGNRYEYQFFDSFVVYYPRR
jgi:hypothetical protein